MKKLPLLIITIVFFAVFGILAMNYQDRYANDGRTLVLDEDISDSLLQAAIIHKGYLPSEDDAAFAARHIASILRKGESLGSLYDLNKRVWKIPADSIALNGSDYYREQLLWENQRMGQDDEFKSLNPMALNSISVVDAESKGQIKIQIDGYDRPASDVVVRLYEHYIDETGQPLRKIVAYTKTDSEGHAEFRGLPENASYSVIPIKEGYEYGSSQGTVGGTLENVGDDSCLKCRFTEKIHSLKVFDTISLRNIKSDHVIVVRSLNSFIITMAIYVALIFAAWWLLFIIYTKRNRNAVTSLINLMACLTGICLLMMFSMNDPLNDRLLGVDMSQGILAGIAVMMLLQKIDFKAFYQDRCRVPFDIPAAIIKWMFKPFGKKLGSFFDRLPKGWGYMFTAVFLTLLLFTPLGASVGGMKVNLNIGIVFQPSEIAKYLIVIFMAAFFCANADTIVKFSQKGNVDLFGVKMKMLAGILLGLGFLMGLYLLLGDMGPSMVLAFTFIIMYSVIKSKTQNIWSSDLAMLAFGVLSFIVMLAVGNMLGCMWLFCILWFVLWLLIGRIRKQFFESAFVFNLIIAAFIFGSSILGMIPGLGSVAERLESRNEMCTNTWGVLPLDGDIADPGENTQVAEGLWGISSGGFFGQGIGEGSPNVIPAFHTDMILASIGEEFGFVGLLVVVLLMALLLRRTILHGYATSNPFTFYLCLGIAVVTGVQFIIIALGCTGIIPLTGVTVPFFSFGKVSMILNLAAFGIVLSISGMKSESTTEEIAQMRRREMSRYDYSISLISMVYSVMALFILGVFLNYTLISREKTLIRPVYVNNVNGMPVVEYNPRITRMAETMPIGNIYDRNGIILATSDANQIIRHRDKYIAYGADAETFDKISKSRLRRYYPFGDQLFYMLGDYNSRLFFTSGDQRGYLAEARHLSELRGYDDRMKVGEEYVKVDLVSEEFRPGRYFDNDSILVVRGVQLRDYSPLFDQRDTKPNDIQLTIDARLQTLIQNELDKFVNTPSHKYTWLDPVKNTYSSKTYQDNNQLRISVVVLDAKNGDLLTSAVYPLPDQKRLMSLSDAELMKYDDLSKDNTWKSYTDMDLGLLYPTQPGSTAKVMSSMAALISDGLVVSDDLKYFNSPEERVGYEYKDNLNKYLTMRRALSLSSNNFFINLVNDKDLYDELAKVYSLVGARLQYEQSYSLFFDPDYDNGIDTVMTMLSKHAVSTYDKYVKDIPNKGRKKLSMHAAWQLAWGQGEVTASPLTMARVASIVANGGSMPVTRYMMQDAISNVELKGMSQQDLKYLKECMGEEGRSHDFDAKVYGKTGTAQRNISKKYKEQDGWYMGYCEGIDGPIAFAVRLERGPGSGSAVTVTKQVVIPALKKLNYIK